MERSCTAGGRESMGAGAASFEWNAVMSLSEPAVSDLLHSTEQAGRTDSTNLMRSHTVNHWFVPCFTRVCKVVPGRGAV